MSKLKRTIIVSLGGYFIMLMFIPYVCDVFNNSVSNYFLYFNPIFLYDFYKDKLFLLGGAGLLIGFVCVLLDTNSNSMVIEHEDVARLATLDEVRKSFKKLPIERSSKTVV